MRLRLLAVTLALLPGVVARPACAAWPASPLLGLPLCTEAHNQYVLKAVPDGAGGVLLAWIDTRHEVGNDGNTDIYAQHVLAGGAVDPAWPADGVAVCTATYRQQAPCIVSDGAGGAVIAWEDVRDGVGFDVYAQRVLAGGVVDPAWPTDGRAICALPEYQNVPAILADGAGGAMIVWQDNRNAGDSSTDLYSHHVRADGTLDPAWPTDGLAVCTDPSQQQHPAVVGDGAGGMVVSWLDDRDGATHPFAQHVLGSGSVDGAWPVAGQLLGVSHANYDYSPVITGDGAGGAIVAWQGLGIHAGHVLASGAADPQWPDSGVALCGPNTQETPAIVADGAGGAIVAWEDVRSGVRREIYAQRVRSNGVVDAAWPAGGRALCSATGTREYVAMVGDGRGGAIVAWGDEREGSPWVDVYAQHVGASGDLDSAWPADGAPVATGPSYQTAPAVVPDGLRGALVAYQDNRAGNFDVYAQRIAIDGTVGSSLAAVASPRPPQGLALAGPAPNPSDREAGLRFSLARPGGVRLAVFDAAGRHVRELVNGERAAGSYAATWNLCDEDGRRVRAGRYFVRLQSGGETARQALVVRP